MANSFRDFIPEGEDLGAFGGGAGFADFAPDPVIKPQEEISSKAPAGAINPKFVPEVKFEPEKETGVEPEPIIITADVSQTKEKKK